MADFSIKRDFFNSTTTSEVSRPSLLITCQIECDNSLTIKTHDSFSVNSSGVIKLTASSITINGSLTIAPPIAASSLPLNANWLTSNTQQADLAASGNVLLLTTLKTFGTTLGVLASNNFTFNNSATVMVTYTVNELNQTGSGTIIIHPQLNSGAGFINIENAEALRLTVAGALTEEINITGIFYLNVKSGDILRLVLDSLTGGKATVGNVVLGTTAVSVALQQIA